MVNPTLSNTADTRGNAGYAKHDDQCTERGDDDDEVKVRVRVVTFHVVENICHLARQVNPLIPVFLRPTDARAFVQLVPGLHVNPHRTSIHESLPFTDVPARVTHLE